MSMTYFYIKHQKAQVAGHGERRSFSKSLAARPCSSISAWRSVWCSRAFPILWMFFSSLKSNTEIFALPPRLLPDGVHARGLPVDLHRSGQGPLLPQQLSRRRRGDPADGGDRHPRRPTRSAATRSGCKNPLNVFIISTQTVPPITLLIPYFGMVVAFGIFDTYFALILTYLVFTLPYAILLMTGYPEHPAEGAGRGGAGRRRVELDRAVAGHRAAVAARHRRDGGLYVPACRGTSSSSR